jgi:hypothetical protein
MITRGLHTAWDRMREMRLFECRSCKQWAWPTKEDTAGLCGTCAFWTARQRTLATPRSLVAKGCMYSIGNEDCKSSFRGFGGQAWLVRFNDGRLVYTSNLWYNGQVPALFADRIKDTGTLQDVNIGQRPDGALVYHTEADAGGAGIQMSDAQNAVVMA